MPKARVNPIAFLVVVTTLAVFGLTLLLLFVPMPESNADTIKSALGQIVIAWVAIVMYYFGSSKSELEIDPHGGKPPKEGE
jgi:hypothetical protein